SGLLHALHINGAVSLTLGPLDDSSVALLVERLHGASPDRVLLDQAADAAGNPLYVKELVDAPVRADRHEPGAPRSLAGVVASRLGLLSTEAREMLRVAALLGGGFTITELATVLGA